LGIAEISQTIGLPKSTIAGLIAALEINGYLEQHSQFQKYGSGFKLVEHLGVLLEQFDICMGERVPP
jgi:DNA-binding IclR family transcriptional regulator